MAVTLTIADVATSWGTSDDANRATRILRVATEKVREYLGDAYSGDGVPTEILNEAVIRFGGYLAQSDYGGVQSEGVGPLTVTYTTNHANMFRTSGAMALLSPYKVRRAGVL